MPRVKNAEHGKYASPDGSKTWEYLSILTCSVFAFTIGNSVGWLSPTIIQLLEPGSPIPFTPDDISTMVASGAFGHLVAPVLSGVLVNRIGRRSTLLLSALPLIVSSAIIMIASRVWMIHLSRVLAGLSLGMCICVTPMYMGEVASTKTRGLAGSTFGVMINLGVLFSYGICPYLSIPWVAGILMSITILYELGFWFMPETPYYLAMKGRHREAEEVLEKLRGMTNVSEELDMIKDTTEKSEKPDRNGVKSGTLRDLFTGRSNIRGLAIALIFLVPQHLGGYFLIIIYGELIFKDATSSIDSHFASIAVGVTQLISSILAGLLVDRLGRRPMILGAGVTSGIANAIIGGHLFAKEYMHLDLDNYDVFFLVAVLVQVFSFNCGLLSTHMIIMSEIFATEVKGIGMCFMGICSAVLGIISSKLYISVAITWGFGHSVPFLAFAILVWISTGLLLWLTPETKGKTFLQIQRELNT